MKKPTFPCLKAQLVPSNKIVANDYNPNKVATPEMKLLAHSIEEDGVTQPVVVFYDEEKDLYTVVDGFHRFTVITQHFKSEVVPVVVIDKPIADRMASTVRHNRARGKHGVEPMAEIVVAMQKEGKTTEEIAKNLGMDYEELLRLLQQKGLAQSLNVQSYSNSWEWTQE